MLGLSWSGVVNDHRCVAPTYHTYQLDNENDEMTGFLVELFAFLGSRWNLWLRPSIIFLFIIGGLLMLSNGLFESFLPHRVDDTLVPFRVVTTDTMLRCSTGTLERVLDQIVGTLVPV